MNQKNRLPGSQLHQGGSEAVTALERRFDLDVESENFFGDQSRQDGLQVIIGRDNLNRSFILP